VIDSMTAPDTPASELADSRRTQVRWPLRVGVAPARANEFSARPETAPNLAAALVPGSPVALVPSRPDGTAAPDWMRLSGKTQLAVATAEALWQARQIELLVWVTATSRASVLTTYVEAAAAIAGAAPAGTAELVAARLVNWLNETNRPWLLVLDDLSRSADLRGLWPAGLAGRVLVTTSDSGAVSKAMPRGTRTIPIGLYSSREALNYLMGRLSADPDRRLGAIDLAKQLDSEPLALAQACSVITSSAWTCRDYQEAFVRRREQMTEASSGPLPAAAVTWTFCFEQADWLSPEVPAQALLALVALLDGHAVPAGVLSAPAARDYLANYGGGARPDRDSAGRTLLMLERSGMVTIDRTTTPPMIRMSTVLQGALRSTMPEGMLEQAARSAADALLEAWPAEEPPGWLAESLRACTSSLWRAAGDLLWAGGCHPVLMRSGESLDSAKLTGPAADYWRDLASVSERLLGADHPDTLTAVQRLIDAYLAAGRTTDAVRWVQWVLDRRARTLGRDHRDVLAARRDLGHALVAAGQLRDAVGVLEQLAADTERVYGEDSLETLGARDELAAAYLAFGQPAEAADLYRGTLAGRERVQGARHAQTLITRQGLGDASLADGRIKDAISAYKKVLSGREKEFGPDDLQTIEVHSKLGAAYHAQGKMAVAVYSYQQARDGYQRTLGPDNPYTLSTSLRLALALNEVGRMGDARALLRETAARCERVLPPGDPLTAQAEAAMDEIAGPSERSLALSFALLSFAHEGGFVARPADEHGAVRHLQAVGRPDPEAAEQGAGVLGQGRPPQVAVAGLAQAVHGQGRRGHGLDGRIVRHSPVPGRIGGQEVVFRGSDRRVPGGRQAGEPLPDPVHSRRVQPGRPELPHPGRHRAHHLGRPCGRAGPLDQVDVFLEAAGAEEVPRFITGRMAGRMVQPGCTEAEPPARGFRPGRDVPPEAARAVRDPQRDAGPSGRQVLHEGLGVAAGRGQDGHDVPGNGPGYVIPGAAVVPHQPAVPCGQPAGHPHQAGRIRPEQHVAPGGHPRQDLRQYARVTAIVFHRHCSVPIQVFPDAQSASGLGAEPCVAAGQGQAHPDLLAGAAHGRSA
jgi:tetratricopeptide (TPR) repeat protein